MTERQEQIKKLFDYRKPLIIDSLNGLNTETIYQRLVGDIDLQSARRAGLRFSGDYRKKLRNKDSDEYNILINELDEYTREQRIMSLLFDKLIHIRTKAEREFYFPEPEELDQDATTEEMEEFQRKFDSWEADRNTSLNEQVIKEIEKEKAELDKLSDEELRNELIEAKINSECETTLNKRFQEMSTYLGTYVDENYTQLLFKNFNEFQNSNDALKNQLIKGYTDLEMSTLNLKEWRRVLNSEASTTSPQKQDNQSIQA